METEEPTIRVPFHRSLGGHGVTQQTTQQSEDRSAVNRDPAAARQTWGKKIEFLLTAISYAVGLGNVWRFPHLAYSNGGGAFLVPYIFMLAFVGLPLFFLELALGQFASLGAITIWRLAPLFKGIGYSMLITSLVVSIYYNVILALTFFYLFASFTTELPWASCNNAWNTELCIERVHHGRGYCHNYTVDDTHPFITNCTETRDFPKNVTSPAQEYWKYFVLGETADTNIGHVGELRWRLVLCLLLSWIVIFLCVFKGIKSSGKVVYFTATFPYLVLGVLFIRGVTLEGAGKGIVYYLKPTPSKIFQVQVWKDAAVQILYSLGIGFGGLLTMSSYNQFHNNCYRDAILVSVINCSTSVFAGFVIFSVLGFMAEMSQQDIADVVEKGPGLAFIAYPEALAMMAGAPFWSVLFFFMLFTLGLGSTFPALECIMTGICDEFPVLRKWKMWLTLVTCIVLFFLGLPCVTQGGMYVVEMMDVFATSIPLLFITFAEISVVCWVYGVRRFRADVLQMIGFVPNYYWQICWVIVTPVVLILILISNCIAYDGLEYNGYKYPPWAEFIGWFLALVSLIMIPVWAVVAFFQSFYTCHNLCWFLRRPRAACQALRLYELVQPTDSWGPALRENRTQQVRYYPSSDLVNILAVQGLEDDLAQLPQNGSVQLSQSEATSNGDLNPTNEGSAETLSIVVGSGSKYYTDPTSSYI